MKTGLIQKHVAIICSTGRTGTSFFARVLPNLIPGSFCVHEPDVWVDMSLQSIGKIRRFGLYHMVIGRLLGTTGLRNLSQRYLSGRLPQDGAVEALYRHRNRYYGSVGSDIIVESNGQWYGLLPLMPHVFAHYRFAGIVRDPRTWVASSMNYGHIYGPRDFVSRFGFRRLNPSMVNSVHAPRSWHNMNRFERICWTWAAVNSLLTEDIAADPNAQLFRYEDLFSPSDAGTTMRDMIQFITRFSDCSFESRDDPNARDNRINAASRASFPDWPNWSREQAQTLQEICGPLMRRHGYGNEPEWCDMLK